MFGVATEQKGLSSWETEWRGEVGIQGGMVPQTKSQAAAFLAFLCVKPAWFHIPKGESSLQPHSVTQCLPWAVLTSSLAESGMIKSN